MRNVDVSSGIRKSGICGGSFSVSRVAVIIAGNAAIDERPLNAIACAGSAARANSRRPMRPKTTAIGYCSAIKTIDNPETTTM